MKNVSLNFGIGEVGGGSQLRPAASNLVKAEATARAGRLGGAGGMGTVDGNNTRVHRLWGESSRTYFGN